MSSLESKAEEQLETERWLLGIAGELPPLLERHQLDKHGWCMVCRGVRGWWWPWPIRITCTVRAELGFSMRRLNQLVPSVIGEHNMIRATR
jgi:hypothetical protein